MIRGLTRFIDIERHTGTRDDHGEETDAWTALVLRRPSSYRPLSGDERFTSEQFIARQQVEFIIRWSENVADLSPLDRVAYPAADSSPSVSEIYDIMDVQEVGRREGFRIVAARRAET